MRTYRSNVQPDVPALPTRRRRGHLPGRPKGDPWRWANVSGTSLMVPSGIFQIWLDSPRELVELHDTPAVQVNAREQRLVDVVNDPGWNFGRDAGTSAESEPALRRLLLDGWPEGATEAATLAASITENLPDPKAFRRLFRWNETEGEEASFERAQLQLPAWRATYRNWKVGVGVVEIVAPWGDACNADYNKIRWTGAALLALADILDRADLRTEIVLLNVCDSKAVKKQASTEAQSERVVLRLQLKEAGDPLSAETIAAVVSHPGVWRTYGLAGYELTPWYLGPSRRHDHVNLRYVPDAQLAGLFGNPRALTVQLHSASGPYDAANVVTQALANLAEQLGSKGEGAD